MIGLFYERTKCFIHSISHIFVSINNDRDHSFLFRDTSEQFSFFSIEDDASLEYPNREIIKLETSIFFEIGWDFREIGFIEARRSIHRRIFGIAHSIKIGESGKSDKEDDSYNDELHCLLHKR